MNGSRERTNRVGAIASMGSCVAIAAAFLGCTYGTPASGDASRDGKRVEESPFELSTGVVIDPAAHVAYVMSERGGIDAVDLKSGERRWHASDGDKPIALADGLLLSMVASLSKGRVLALAVLDVHADGRAVQTKTVDLPSGVEAGVDHGVRSGFLVGGKTAGREVVVSWEFESHAGGDAPGPDVGATVPSSREPTIVRGAFRIELATGATSAATPDAALLAPLSSRPSATAELLPVNKGTQYLSADGRHVLSAERVARDASWDRYVWTLTDRASGRELGQARVHWSSAPFFFNEPSVVFVTRPAARTVDHRLVEEGVRLRATDLRSGKEEWSWPIRNAAYRGRGP